jgi:RNA polymerase sigma-70 factor (ECF subfamily)
LSHLVILPSRDENAAMAEPDLNRIYDEGRAAWPSLNADREGFVRHFSGRGVGESAFVASELYIAYACAAGVAGAIEAFERTFMSRVNNYLARMNPTDAFMDDVRQTMREKLFVGAAPKISDYSGRGSLDGWLRTIALRLALNATTRGATRKAEPDPMAQLRIDPEIDMIKERYKAQFTRAFERSLSSLTSEHRTLLRMHFVEGITLDQLAAVFHVHRGTVARRIAAARRAILDETRQLLASELALSPDECNSLVGLLRSRLDLSIATWLKAE